MIIAFLLIGPALLAFLFLFVRNSGRPTDGTVETEEEKAQRLATNIVRAASVPVAVVGAVLNAKSSGTPNGYSGGYAQRPQPTPEVKPIFQGRSNYIPLPQQPSYIQAQPWFQQPYYAAQMPPAARSALFQYQTPFPFL